MSSFDLAFQQWRSGHEALARIEGVRRIASDRVCEALLVQLRRRLGSSFTTDELVELYDRGTSWCLDVAIATAPGAPWAWDERVTADATFFRYVREAQDFAGGRRIALEQDDA